MTQELHLMSVDDVPTRKGRPSRPAGRDLRRRPNRVSTVIDLAAATGVPIDAGISTSYAKALAFSHSPVPKDPSPSAGLATQLAGGTITTVQATAKITKAAVASPRAEFLRLRRDTASAVYLECCSAIEATADDILAGARVRLAETVAERTAVGMARPELSQRYEDLHDLAAALRWATGTLERTCPPDWWRFRRPELAWRFRFEQVPWSTTFAKRSNVEAGITSSVNHLRFVKVVGAVAPSLDDVVANPEWLPDLVTADEILAHHAVLVDEYEALAWPDGRPRQATGFWPGSNTQQEWDELYARVERRIGRPIRTGPTPPLDAA